MIRRLCPRHELVPGFEFIEEDIGQMPVILWRHFLRGAKRRDEIIPQFLALCSHNSPPFGIHIS
jgi:hypothetical protein